MDKPCCRRAIILQGSLEGSHDIRNVSSVLSQWESQLNLCFSGEDGWRKIHVPHTRRVEIVRGLVQIALT